MADGGITVEVITSEQGLAELEPAWRALWCRTAAAAPFQSPWWLLPWWRTFRPGELRTVAVRAGSRLAGLGLFYIHGRGSRRLLLPVGISLSDYVDVLIDDGVRESVLAAVGGVLSAGTGWDEVWLPDVPPDAALASIAVDNVRCERNRGTTCPVLELAGDDGLAHVPAGRRRKLRMARHRLSRAERGRIIEGEELEPAMWWEHLRRLHGAQWHLKGEPGVLGDEMASTFHRSAILATSRAGIARLLGVEIGGQVVGVYYGFQRAGRAYAYLGGIDPVAAYYSPGALLIGHAIGTAAREGARELHFLRGGERYKYDWGAVDRPNSDMRIVLDRS